jgi:putative transposase
MKVCSHRNYGCGGLPVEAACRVLSASVSGFYVWRSRSPSKLAIRHTWLTDVIRQVRADSRAVYGCRRVHVELAVGHGIAVGKEAVHLSMCRPGLQGISGWPRWRRTLDFASAGDPVDRRFHRDNPDQLWVTEHPTREGKVHCVVVLDTFSRGVVGWSIDSSATAALVTHALEMAIESRRPPGTVIHSGQGTQSGFTSWAYTQRAVESGLMPSMGSIGDCYDNALVESFWSRRQVELLDQQRWKTRVELANAIFEYLEIFHNRQRRHSAPSMITHVEFEALHYTTTVA